MTNQDGSSTISRQDSRPDPQACHMALSPVIKSEDLLQGMTEVFISHGDELYRLRVTRNGKLLLHK